MEEKNSSARIVAALVNLLRSTPGEPPLKENARKSHQALAQEIESNLALFEKQLPAEEILQLARSEQIANNYSEIKPAEKAIQLVQFGLRVYCRSRADLKNELPENNFNLAKEQLPAATIIRLARWFERCTPAEMLLYLIKLGMRQLRRYQECLAKQSDPDKPGIKDN